MWAIEMLEEPGIIKLGTPTYTTCEHQTSLSKPLHQVHRFFMKIFF